MSTLVSSIKPIHTTLSGSATPGQIEPGSDDNKEMIHIPQSITGA